MASMSYLGYMQAYNALRMLRKKCLRCKNKARRGKVTCMKCALKQSAYNRRKQNEVVAA